MEDLKKDVSKKETIKRENENEYREERFDYAVYVNDFIICKRNFKINNFIEGSMETLEFKDCVEKIVNLIDDDLKSKSRVYLWRYYNPDFPDAEPELVSPLIEPWACTFKFVVYDRGKEVISKIWDGYAYPKYVRDRVDLSNKYIRVNSGGVTYSYDKYSFFSGDNERLTFDQEMLKAMIMDKPDLLLIIVKKICEYCSPTKEELGGRRFLDSREAAKFISAFTQTESFAETSGSEKKKDYSFAVSSDFKKKMDEWGRYLSKKTKNYMKTLY